MKSLEIAGTTLLFDNEDYNRLKGERIYIVQNGFNKVACYVRDSRRVYLAKEIMQTGKNEYVEYLDGNRMNLQKNNLKIISRRELNQNRRHPYGNKFKGVNRENNGYFIRFYTSCNRRVTVGPYVTDEQAAGYYNALADDLGLPGYRNPVPKLSMTPALRMVADKIRAKWRPDGFEKTFPSGV